MSGLHPDRCHWCHSISQSEVTDVGTGQIFSPKIILMIMKLFSIIVLLFSMPILYKVTHRGNLITLSTASNTCLKCKYNIGPIWHQSKLPLPGFAVLYSFKQRTISFKHLFHTQVLLMEPVILSNFAHVLSSLSTQSCSLLYLSNLQHHFNSYLTLIASIYATCNLVQLWPCPVKLISTQWKRVLLLH